MEYANKVLAQVQKVLQENTSYFLTCEKGVYYAGEIYSLKEENGRVILFPKNSFLITGETFEEISFLNTWSYRGKEGYITEIPKNRPGACFLMGISGGSIKIFKDKAELNSAINERFIRMATVLRPLGI